MKTLQYKIEFFSYWHASSGLSSGAEADLTVIKDKNNLPYIPGKTLKGLLREAAETIYEANSTLISKEFITKIFGETPSKNQPSPIESEVFFCDANLTKKLHDFFKNNADKKKNLYQTIASTKIDNQGQAVDHSLRSIQVTIPIELYSQIIDFPEEYTKEMELCFAFVKRMGLNRNRGLGRCLITKVK